MENELKPGRREVTFASLPEKLSMEETSANRRRSAASSSGLKHNHRRTPQHKEDEHGPAVVAGRYDDNPIQSDKRSVVFDGTGHSFHTFQKYPGNDRFRILLSLEQSSFDGAATKHKRDEIVSFVIYTVETKWKGMFLQPLPWDPSLLFSMTAETIFKCVYKAFLQEDLLSKATNHASHPQQQQQQQSRQRKGLFKSLGGGGRYHQGFDDSAVVSEPCVVKHDHDKDQERKLFSEPFSLGRRHPGKDQQHGKTKRWISFQILKSVGGNNSTNLANTREPS